MPFNWFCGLHLICDQRQIIIVRKNCMTCILSGFGTLPPLKITLYYKYCIILLNNYAVLILYMCLMAFCVSVIKEPCINVIILTMDLPVYHILCKMYTTIGRSISNIYDPR